MTKYIVKHTKLFKKDYKLALKRKLNIELLQNVISKLANGEKLDPKLFPAPGHIVIYSKIAFLTTHR